MENYALKGWTQPKYAVNHKFIGGSLSEYAQRKLKLIAETDTSLPESWRIILVIAGLPDSISCKIDRDKIRTISELITKINQLDRPQKMSNKPHDKTDKKEILNNKDDKKRFNPDHKPCRFCEKIGKPGRFHPESECKTRLNPHPGKNFTNINKLTNVDKNFKVTNNTEIEDVLNQELVPKN